MSIPKERFGRINGFRFSKMPEYNSWSNMCYRCSNPKNPRYRHYGGRGIKVCERWRTKNGFLNFLEDMGQKPSPEHSINRINNDMGYSPENCEWSNARAQAVNKQIPKNKYLGVNWIPANNKYRVKIGSNGNHIHVGLFIDPIEAALAYDCAAVQLHEPGAATNFL